MSLKFNPANLPVPDAVSPVSSDDSDSDDEDYDEDVQATRMLLAGLDNYELDRMREVTVRRANLGTDSPRLAGEVGDELLRRREVREAEDRHREAEKAENTALLAAFDADERACEAEEQARDQLESAEELVRRACSAEDLLKDVDANRDEWRDISAIAAEEKTRSLLALRVAKRSLRDAKRQRYLANRAESTLEFAEHDARRACAEKVACRSDFATRARKLKRTWREMQGE